MNASRIRIIVVLFWAVVAAWLILRPDPTWAPVSAPAGEGHFWFKGNTHSHAQMTVQDYRHGDATPAEAAAWYRDHGYHFVAITDHNRFNAETTLLRDQRDFLVIPGMEVTSDHRYPGVNGNGERKLHTTALNVANEIEWDFDHDPPAVVMDLQVQRIRSAGGLAILNHPNYFFQVTLNDLLATESVTHFEVFNAHPRSNQDGHAGFRPGVESLWDQALSRGRLLYGIAADDAHDFGWHRQLLRRFGMAPPGGAWIMVRAPKLDAGEITTAITGGDFYASTGVHLKAVLTGSERYEVHIDLKRTREEISHAWVRDAAPVVHSDDSHYVIEFIGEFGQVLHATHDQAVAGIPFTQGKGYIRARISYIEPAPRLLDGNRARIYHAWTQPVMLPDPVSHP